jgi:hypothetical protein
MEFHLYCVRSGPPDGIPEELWIGMPVADYIAWRREHEAAWRAEIDSERYQLALRAAMTHPWYDPARAAPPSVHYNPHRDEAFYAFHAAGGYSLLVSLHPIRGLQERAMAPRLYHDYRVVGL